MIKKSQKSQKLGITLNINSNIPHVFVFFHIFSQIKPVRLEISLQSLVKELSTHVVDYSALRDKGFFFLNSLDQYFFYESLLQNQKLCLFRLYKHPALFLMEFKTWDDFVSFFTSPLSALLLKQQNVVIEEYFFRGKFQNFFSWYSCYFGLQNNVVPFQKKNFVLWLPQYLRLSYFVFIRFFRLMLVKLLLNLTQLLTLNSRRV